MEILGLDFYELVNDVLEELASISSLIIDGDEEGELRFTLLCLAERVAEFALRDSDFAQF